MSREAILLILLIVLPFLGSAIIGFFRSTARNNEAWFAGAIALLCLLFTVMLFPTINNGGVARLTIEWLPQWGLNFSLRMDGFSWLFSLLISGIGLLVVIYARYYMNPADPVPRFFSFFLAFMGSMMGVVLSGNLVLMVIFWELTSIFSFLLIGYWYHNASARDGARIALTITGIGGFGLLVGVLLIGHVVGSYELDTVLNSAALIRKSPLYLPILLCICLAAFTKSAQFPFHFWLPNAMAAPTPVSAYLHSATMVKAGLFLLVRFWPILAGTESWFWIVGLAGLTSLLLGAYFAMFQQDLKGLLAYSTIGHLGLIATLLSLGSPLGCVAAIFHIANHAIFKASLFMAVGIIDHETGTRDMRKLSGLFRYMPYTATLALVASSAMAGVPLLNGFLSKEMFFSVAAETNVESWLDWITPYVAVIASLFSVTYSVRFMHGVFFGQKPRDLPKIPHEPPRFMLVPVEFLVFLCLLIGIAPNFSVRRILDNAVVAVLPSAPPEYSLAIWHGFGIAIVMSVIALVGGIVLYIFARNYLNKSTGPLFFRHIVGQRIFERLLVTISWKWARAAESLFGTRRLQPQVRWLIVVPLILMAVLVWGEGILPGDFQIQNLDIPFATIWIIGCICAIGAAILAKFHRLASLVFLGGTGLATCATFLWLSAPDLAVTQLVVEIVTTILILLGLRWLPKRWQNPEPPKPTIRVRLRRGRDFLLALMGGVGIGWLSYVIMTRTPIVGGISEYFLRNSYSEAGGKNVVNVILVDFRGFDTMGEITVLGIVALSIYAILRRFRPAPDSIEPPSEQKIQTAFDEAEPDRETGQTLIDYMAVPSVFMHWLFPVIIAFAVHIFIRGHDMPGGGFAGGIILAIGFILQYISGGTRWVESHLNVFPLRWMGFGLLMALATGVGAWVFGYPFLKSFFSYVDLPIIGKTPAASALLFDLGVFALVVGATVLMLIAIAHQSIRHYRIGQPQKNEDH